MTTSRWGNAAWQPLTPCYLYDFDRAHSDIRDMRRIMGDRMGLCFAMKANPFLAAEIASAVDRIEVCSMGEYRICRSVGLPAEKLYISGVLKEPAEIREILGETRGRSLYTIESPNQYRLISGWARETGTAVSVFPRCSSGNQFGMDEETLTDVLTQIEQDPFVRTAGIHFFSGTQKRNAGQIIRELETLREMFCRNPHITDSMELEFGPGLKVDYFSENSWEKSLTMLEETVQALDRLSFPGAVTLEMGRGIAANCGFYLTQVRDVKTSFGNSVAIVDGGIHQMNYDGQMMGMKHPAVSVLPADGAAERPLSAGAMCWDVFGSLCTTRDILLKQAPLGELAVGDVLVFPQTGAYSSMEGVTLLLSHELPAIYGYTGQGGLLTLRERMDTWTLNHKA